MSDIFNTAPPQIRNETAQEFLYKYYGISGSLDRLSSDRDLNFKITSPDGVFVMKIANSSEDKNILEMQNMAIRHISSQNDDFELPTPLSSNQNKEILIIEDGNNKYLVRLLTYIEGDFLKDVKQNNKMLFSVGEFLGNLDRALESFSHNASEREFIWDAAQIDTLSHQLKYSKSDKSLIQFFINTYKDRVHPHLGKLSKSIIHNDGNDHNVIIGSNGKIKSIIDFGDMTFTLKALEPAVSMAYTAISQDNPFELLGSLLKGYNSVQALSKYELEAVMYLMCLRMCVTINMSVYRKKLFPENDYISISENNARSFLRFIRDDDIHKWSNNLCEYVKS